MKKKIISSTKNFNTIEVVFLVLITCILSLFFGSKIIYKDEKKDKFLSEIEKVYLDITNNYYDNIEKEDLVSGAIAGMTNVLDKHSLLIDKDDDYNFYLNLEGSYSGIGIEVTNDNKNNIIIFGVLSESPAEKAGLKAGDIIVKIDNIDLTNKDFKYVSNYIKNNSSKKEFEIEIKRNEELLKYKIKKDNVTIKSVLSKIIERDSKKIGYIYISIFSNTTVSQFKKELNELLNNNIDALIIDVRENSGGHLSTAVEILSELVSNKKIIYQIEKDNKKTKEYSTGKKDIEIPLAVIQNSNSASASEMLSISLKENLGALIVGEKSYGKGTVQELKYLDNGDSYKYTTKKWLSPKGNWIEDSGVEPDITIELEEKFYNNPIIENDNQLQRTIEEIIKKI